MISGINALISALILGIIISQCGSITAAYAVHTIVLPLFFTNFAISSVLFSIASCNYGRKKLLEKGGEKKICAFITKIGSQIPIPQTLEKNHPFIGFPDNVLAIIEGYADVRAALHLKSEVGLLYEAASILKNDILSRFDTETETLRKELLFSEKFIKQVDIPETINISDPLERLFAWAELPLNRAFDVLFQLDTLSPYNIEFDFGSFEQPDLRFPERNSFFPHILHFLLSGRLPSEKYHIDDAYYSVTAIDRVVRRLDYHSSELFLKHVFVEDFHQKPSYALANLCFDRALSTSQVALEQYLDVQMSVDKYQTIRKVVLLGWSRAFARMILFPAFIKGQTEIRYNRVSLLHLAVCGAILKKGPLKDLDSELWKEYRFLIMQLSGESFEALMSDSSHFETIEHLLILGFDPLHKDPQGNTPKMLAIQYGLDREIIDLL